MWQNCEQMHLTIKWCQRNYCDKHDIMSACENQKITGKSVFFRRASRKTQAAWQFLDQISVWCFDESEGPPTDLSPQSAFLCLSLPSTQWYTLSAWHLTNTKWVKSGKRKGSANWTWCFNARGTLSYLMSAQQWYLSGTREGISLGHQHPPWTFRWWTHNVSRELNGDTGTPPLTQYPPIFISPQYPSF